MKHIAFALAALQLAAPAFAASAASFWLRSAKRSASSRVIEYFLARFSAVIAMGALGYES